ncbi:MAG: glycosyltransferase family 39 protein [Candidatus Dormiibacterota bacterium]
MSFWFSALGGLVLEAVLLGLAGFTAYRVGCALAPEPADLLERIVFAGLVGITGWVALLQVLGLIGVLWLPVVAACLAVFAAISLLALPSPAPRRVVASPVPWGLVAVAAPFAVLALVEVLWGPPLSNSYDTVHYHIVNAAHYLDSGTIRSLPFALPGDNTGAAPGNGSLLLLAVMLPFHNSGLVALPNLLCAGLLVAVTALLSRELGRGAWPGLVTGLVIVTTVCFFETQVRSAYDDAVGLLGLLAAVLFGLRSARGGERRTVLLAGLSLGLAVGTKGSYILPGVAVAAVVLWAHRARPGRGWALGFLAATLSLCAAWYVRDWIITGDPLFPQTVRIGSRVVLAGLSGSAAAYSRYDQSLAGAVLAGGGSGVARWVGPALLNFGVSLAAPAGCLVLVWLRGRARLVAVAALACTAAYVVTPFTGSSLPAQLTGGLRFLLPAVALGVVAIGATLPDRWFRLSAVVALAVGAVLLIDVEWSDSFVNVPLLVVAGAVTVGVLAAIRWRGGLGVAARKPTVRGAAAFAVAILAVLATAHLQPSTSPTPVQRALDAARNPGAPVVVMDVGDVATILGPQLDTDIVAVGDGPVGAERPIRNPAQLTLRIEALHPAAVVVGTVAEFDVVPVTWAPPATWRMLGTQDGAVVYEP